MATPSDLLDRPVLISYSGLVDASTAAGQVDEATDWIGAIAGSGDAAAARAAAVSAARAEKPARHLAHITKRRGAYSPVR